MTTSRDNGESSDSDSKCSTEPLSLKARRIKKQIAEGTYKIDFESLADHILEAEAIEDRKHSIPLPASDEVKNDQSAPDSDPDTTS